MTTRNNPAPPPAVMLALTLGTLAPALVIAAIRGLWPQPWVRIAIALAAVAGVTVSTWYLRRRIPRRPGQPMQIEQVNTPSAATGLLGLYVTPCAVTLAAQPASRWAAVVALVFIGIVAARSGAVLTANPLLVVIGVHTYHVQVRQLGQPEAPAQNVVLLSRDKNPDDTGSPLENLIPVSDGVYMHGAEPTAA